MKENKIKKQNEEKGITLIALVITIVVLLILAGVSIAMLTGNNGILSQAQKAGEETELGEEKEAIRLAYNGAKIKKQGGAVTDVDLDEQFSLNDTKADAEGNSPITVTFTESLRKYTIDENGVIAGPITGEEQPEQPQEPETPEEPELTVANLQQGDRVYYDTGVSSVGDNGVIELYKLENNKFISMEALNCDFEVFVDLKFDNLSAGFDKAIKDTYVNPTYAETGYSYGSGNYGQGTFVASTEDNSYSLYIDNSIIDNDNVPYEILGIGEEYAIPVRYGYQYVPNKGYDSVGFEKYIQGIDSNGNTIEQFQFFSYVESFGYNYDPVYDVREWDYSEECFNKNITIPVRPIFILKEDVEIVKDEGEEVYRLVAE